MTTDNNIERIVVALASNKPYLPGLMTTMYSICKFAKSGSHLVFYVLDDGLGRFARRGIMRMGKAFAHIQFEVRFIDVDTRLFSNLPVYHGSRTTYTRLLLQDILANEDFVIYSDVDMLWKRDVSELWAMRDEEHCIWATPDVSGVGMPETQLNRIKTFIDKGFISNANEYYCAGLMLLNLKRLRNTDFSKRIFEVAAKYTSLITCADQDVYNMALTVPDVCLLPEWWGYFFGTSHEKVSKPCVVHFAEYAPWKVKPFRGADEWWKFFLQSAIDAQMPVIAMRALSGTFIQGIVSSEIGFELFYLPFRLLSPDRYNHRKNRIFAAHVGHGE